MHGLYGIFNLAMSGNMHDASKARAGVSIAIYERGRVRRRTSVRSSARGPRRVLDLVIGENLVRYNDGRYEVSGALKDGSAALRATWTPRTAPLRIDRLGGVVNTFILPSLQVDGVLELRGRQYELRNVTGYHDHNWGVWGWGEIYAGTGATAFKLPRRRVGGERTPPSRYPLCSVA